jgi:hypothetical protein
MKPLPNNRIIQAILGTVLILAILGCNLSKAGTPTSATGKPVSPPVQGSGDQSGGETNNDGKLEMRPTAAPSTPSQPAWKPQLSPVVTKTLAAGQAQSVEAGGNMRLNFPAGAFTETPPELVVSSVSGNVPMPLPGDEVLLAYDVALGDLHSLAEPLEVSMTYDPARLKPGLPAEAQIGAALLDGASGRWMALSTTVDESAHTVNFQTDHLSLVAIYLHTQNDSICRTVNFNVAYNKANIQAAAGNMTYTSTLNACQTSGHPNFINAVADALETAYQGYTAANLPFPESRIKVNVANISDSILWGSESQYDTLTGELVINTDTWGYPNELRQDCAHELFHYWQYKHINSSSYLGNQWWMDATADYAADKVAYASLGAGRTNSMGKDIRASYLEGSLTSNKDFHAYSSAHFVDYLIAQSAAYPTLRDLWDASTTTSSAISDLKSSLSTRLASKFEDVYKDFANYMLFDQSSPLPIKGPLWSSSAVNDGMLYEDGAGPKNSAASVLSYASVVWGLRVQSRKFMSITWTNPNEGAVYVFFDNDGDQRGGTRLGYYLYATKTAIFPMEPETTAYILMVNPSASWLEFDLTISASEVEVYTVGINYDSADGKCAENSAWGTPHFFMEMKKEKVFIHYDSATDDYYWAPGAEHTITGSGKGTYIDGKVEASLESHDTITGLGADMNGVAVTGSVSAQASFTLTESTEMPFVFETINVTGSSNVNLPATTTRSGFTCTGTVKGVSVYPAFYFPLAR